MGIFSKFLKNDKTEKTEATEEKTEIKINAGKKKYKTIIACGSGIATSTMARSKIEKGFEERGILLEVTIC